MNAVAVWADDLVARVQVPLRRLAQRFDARAPRERVVLLAAAAALAFWAADQLWITPAFARTHAAGTRLASAQSELDTLRLDAARLQGVGLQQQRQLKADIALSRQRLDTESTALRAYESTLVPAGRMVEVLEQMLPRNGRLKVRSLQSLGRVDLLAANAPAASVAAVATAASGPAAGAASTGPVLYRHGVELTLEGGWADLLDYLHALETMPRKVLWGGLSMKVEQYPKVVLTLRLYTLSLDRGWLEI